MIRDHIANEETIILAIHPAPSDVRTSKAIEFAREYDKNGNHLNFEWMIIKI